MLVNNVSLLNSQSSVKKNYSNQTFTGVHPVRYYVKWSDGEFYRVTSKDIVKDLQRQIVSWLNSADKMVTKSGKRIKDADVKTRVIDFITANDSDYAKDKSVRSFYNMSRGEQNAYLLTGKYHTDLVDEAAKPIGRAKRKYNDCVAAISENYRMPFSQAKNHVPNSFVINISDASRDYHASVLKMISDFFETSRSKATTLDFYFVPFTTKNKEIKYKLVEQKVN